MEALRCEYCLKILMYLNINRVFHMAYLRLHDIMRYELFIFLPLHRMPILSKRVHFI